MHVLYKLDTTRASTRSMSGIRSRSPFNWLRRSSRSLSGRPESPGGESSTGSISNQMTCCINNNHSKNLTNLFSSLPRHTVEGQEDDGGIYRGHLYRKHVYESMSKAASNRAWNKHFFVVKPGQIVAFKDQKHARQNKPEEPPLSLPGTVIEEARDYKKKHCFKLRFADGNEYMFKAKDDAEMNIWIDNLKAASGEPESSTMSLSSSRAQTLPASSSAPEKKKGGFFTLKRK